MDNKKTKLKNIFFVASGCIILFWLLMDTDRIWQYYDKVISILSPFIIGAVIAFILNVPMRAFERMFKFVKKGSLRRIIAILLTMLSVMLVLAIILPMLVVQLIETYEDLSPKLEHFLSVDLKNWANGFLNSNPELKEILEANTDFNNLDWSTLIPNALSFVGTSLSAILQSLVSAIGSTISGVFNGVISVVFAIYCLFQKETLARQGRKLVYAFLPERWGDHLIRILRMGNTTFSNFLSGQCIEVVILGLMFAVAMAIFGMPHIPLISVVVAITAFIPVVGAWVGCAIGAFLIMVSDPVQAVWFVVLFIVLQQIENNLIYPRVVGTSIGLSGMWVLVAVSVGGSLMGVVGMFLMIPLTSVLYVVFREITDNRLKKRPVPAEKLVAHPIERRPMRHKKSDPISEEELVGEVITTPAEATGKQDETISNNT